MSAADVDDFLAAAFDAAENATSGGGHDHHAHHGHHDHAAMGHDAHAGHAAAHAGGAHDHGGHMMKMWFHGGFEEVILFDWWRTETFCGMFFSCLLIFIMGAAYEGIKWFRVYLQMQQTAAERCPKENGIKLQEQQSLQCKASSQDDVYNPTTTPPMRTSVKRFSTLTSSSAFSTPRLLQAILYVVQLVLAYWLMLIVMTYNNYLTAAVILGAGFGHWLFAVLKIRSPLSETADSFATDACH